ncbi:molybdenum ABC transporter permease [Chitinophaga silvatica]|uniref:Molybdenum ABC transporter permease n=1 Tax=Chitinophaga silvatica TaxID=2282649 RepID=A0A3E1YHI2_9BACT|nr:molybdenum ABC transporter permease [Chitinophaga silvatica]
MGSVYLLILGFIFLIPGIFLRVIISRREFYRRGEGGLQNFPNYRSAVWNTFLERIGKVVARLLIFLGAISLILGVWTW